MSELGTNPAAWISIGLEAITTVLTLCGLAYMMLALLGARQFVRRRRREKVTEAFAPPVSILKPVKGVDAEMMTAFRSHCRQQYDGEYEIIFGVSSLADPAAAWVYQLQKEFPRCNIRLVECPERLGTNGKVSNLVQMLPSAQHAFCIINDSDIIVSEKYLSRVMAEFAAPIKRGSKEFVVGMVTAPYRGRPEKTVWSKLEALGISTDFFAGVMAARQLEGGISFGLGSTLAFRKDALEAAGGLAPLRDYLADDYEMGARISRAGYAVTLCREVVETGVPNYDLHGFWAHQVRWLRAMKSSRRGGYFGLITTYALPWAILNCIVSGGALWSFSLLSLVFLARTAVALFIGVGVLRDLQTLRNLWLVPLRDCIALLLWISSYTDNTIEWRGERFRLSDGKLQRLEPAR